MEDVELAARTLVSLSMSRRSYLRPLPLRERACWHQFRMLMGEGYAANSEYAAYPSPIRMFGTFVMPSPAGGEGAVMCAA